MDFSLIIPCYCEEPFLRNHVLQLVNLFQLTKLNYEFVFVEDCSPDGTRSVLTALSRELGSLQIPHQTIYHEVNQGRGAAVKTGIRAAKGQISGFIDIDLENLPDAIFPMYLTVLSGEADLVVGKRIKTGSDLRPLRRVTHLVYKWMVQTLISLPASDTETGLKVFHTEKIRQILPHTPNNHWFWDTQVVLEADRQGLKIAEHPVIFVRDSGKASTVRVIRDSYLYIKALWGHLAATRNP